MKSLTGKFASSGGWALLLILLLGAGLFVAACGDEDVPTPTTPAPPPTPPPAPPPAPEPEPEPEPEAPAVPVGLRISDSGTDFVEWSWTPVADVSGYDVQFSPNEAFTGEDEIIARTAEEISYRRDGLAEGTSTFLRVRSAAGTGEERITSDWSTHVTGMTEAPTPEPESVPPAMPTGLTVSDRGEDFIEWSWDPVEGAGGYDVQFSENQIFSEEDETISRSVEQVSYRREELETGTSYYLRVRSAAAGTGEERITSDWSTHVTGMTEAPTPVLQPPAMPTGLAVSDRGENFIEWSWDPADGASGYDVQFSENQVFSEEDETISRTVEEVSYRREELEAETSYYLRVRSAAGTGEERITSGWSTHVTGATTAAEPDAPLAPANLRVKGTGSDFIEWEWDDVAGASGYQAQFSTDSAFSDPDTFLLPGASNTSHRVSNLESEADGYLRVRAYLGTLANPVFGEWSEANKATTEEAPAAVALDAPDNLTASDPTNDSITLEWDEVDDADSYEVEQRAAGGSWVDASCGGDDNEVGEIECVASGLDRGTEYTFRVAAIPDSSDETKTRSPWATLDEPASTTGSVPRPRPTGGAGDLNITWRSQGTAITWRWDQAGDVDYQVKVLEGVLDAMMPCEDRSQEWGMATQLGTSHEETGLDGGDAARLLCVRSTWIGSDGKPQYGNSSWAWAATEPTAPVRPSGQDVAVDYEDGITESLSWTVTLAGAGDIQYDFRYLIDDLNKDDDFKALTDENAQSRCQASSSAEMLTPGGSGFATFTTSGDPKDYSAYHLCYRAQNDSGRSDWALALSGAEIYTAPSPPSSVASSCKNVTDDTAVANCEWTVNLHASGPSLPKTDPDQSVGMFYDYRAVMTQGDDRDKTAATDDVAEVCDSQDDTDDLDGITPSFTVSDDAKKTTERRFVVTAEAAREAAGDNASDYYIYLCARAKHGGGSETDDTGRRPGPWKVSGSTRIQKQPGS